MIDVRRLDDRGYRSGIEKKGCPPEHLDALLAADRRRRELQQAVDDLRARQNEASRAIGRAAPQERPARIEAARGLKEELSSREGALREAEQRVRELVLVVPNSAHPDVPAGGEDDYVVLREVGDRPDAPRLDHAALSTALGLVDQERAVRVSGSRFAYLLREAVLLELALVQWAMARLVVHGFCPVVPPVLVREDAMEQAGFFPTDRHQVYAAGSAERSERAETGTEGDLAELFLVGTSEVPLAGLHAGEIVDGDALPLRYGGFSTCFRREAGTYGRDTRGIFRVHQFDKVEMFSYAHPDRSREEHEALLELEESLVAELELPYRVIDVAAGDLGAPAARKYDIEVWLPSEGRYRELTSCSNYTDFSARRAGTRFRSGEGTRLVHTLNGTACAVGRTLVFLFEHHQDDDGGLVVPEALRPWCGFDRVAPAR